jgi:SAM-dependent methyltransferase
VKADATRCVLETPGAADGAVPNFDRLARVYRWMEWASFGPFLWWCRCAFLPEMRVCRRALIIGDGDGRFTARLLETNQEVQVEAVDASAAMLRALVGRAGRHAARVRTICGDVRKVQQESLFACDLVVTHFFLDCLSTEDVRALAERVRVSATEKALWVVSEFAVPEGLFGRWVARPLVGGLYWAFGWLTGLRQHKLPEYAAAMRAAGLGLVKRRTWLGGLLVSEVWQSGEEQA